MMTTVAALFGTLPIALDTERAPMRGSPSASPVSEDGGQPVPDLYITPVIYLYLERVQESSWRKETEPKAREVVA